MKSTCPIFAAALTLTMGLLLPSVSVAAPPPQDDGVVREYFNNGKLRLENVCRNGAVVRKRTFFENGRLQSVLVFKNGLPYVRKFYFENGRLKSVWTRKSGVTKYYYETGELRVIVESPDAKQKLRSSYIFSGE